MKPEPPPPTLDPFPALAEAEILLEKYEEEPTHVRHVAALSDSLFVDLAAWHGSGLRERQWLRLASLLHDIGWSQTPTGRGHHKESARLIAAAPWRHLSGAETAVVAQIARYHRKKIPSDDHAEYRELPEEDRRAVDLLAGLLRVADALDRTHVARVEKATARFTPGKIVIGVVAVGDWSAERRMADEKKDLLERRAGCRVIVERI